jgi:tetratricopeptide (TPR) repeat protein
MSGDSSPPAAAETRKLAAIMFTDIVGFSRQMGTDEARTLHLLAVHNQIVEQALAEAERALTLEPNNPAFHHSLGDILCWAGRPVEGIEFYKKAIRLNPRATAHYLNSLGWGYFLPERYDEAIAALKQSLALNPNFLYAHLNLAGVYSALNRDEEARIEVAEFLRLNPNFSFEVWRQRIPFKDPGLIERAVANLRKAGLK